MKSTSCSYLVLLCILICVSCALEKGEVLNPVHDVAIKDVKVPSTCSQGETVPITVSLVNQGTHKELLQIILTNTTDNEQIGTQSVALSTSELGGIDNSCDGVLSAELEEDSSQFSAWSYSGDLNADGYDDYIAAGGSRYDNNRGRCYIYYGGENMDMTSDLTMAGENNNDYFAENAVGNGDINGDGYNDLLIGAPGWKNNSFQGRVYVYYGGPNIDDTIDLILTGENTAGWFGIYSVLGDVNGDGFDDMIISARAYQNEKGRVYIYFGGTTPDIIADKIIDSPGNEQDLFGYSIAVGNVNGDSYEDIIIAAEDYPNGDRRGRAYLYYGASDMDTLADKVFTGEGNHQRFGNEVILCDVDNDGFDDVVIGAPDGGANYVGRVYLYWGAPDMDVIADWITTAEGSGSGHGNELQYGNFNNDEYPDLYVGQYSYPNKTNLGRFYIYYGNEKALFDTTPDVVVDSPDQVANNRFSQSAASGDFNGDSLSDIIVGSTYNNWMGRGYLYKCNPFHTADILFNWDTTNASIGTHKLKVEIPPVPGEENIEDNVKTVTIEVTKPTK